MTWDDIEYFKPSEFACRCGECGSDGNEMSLDFVNKLNALRIRVGFPLVITSGYRCPAHNTQVSTTGEDGPHTTGHAADISVMGAKAHKLLEKISFDGWFTGIGLNQKGTHAKRFIHLDDLEGDRPRPNVWTY